MILNESLRDLCGFICHSIPSPQLPTSNSLCFSFSRLVKHISCRNRTSVHESKDRVSDFCEWNSVTSVQLFMFGSWSKFKELANHFFMSIDQQVPVTQFKRVYTLAHSLKLCKELNICTTTRLRDPVATFCDPGPRPNGSARGQGWTDAYHLRSAPFSIQVDGRTRSVVSFTWMKITVSWKLIGNISLATVQMKLCFFK